MRPPDERREDDAVVATLVREALQLRAAGNLETSLAKGVAASERARATAGSASAGFRAGINVAAAVYFDRRDYVISRALYEWLSRAAREQGDDARLTSIVDANLGHCLLREGDRDAAEPMLLEAFSRLVDLDGAAATQALHGVAVSAYERGDFEESAQLHRMILDVRRRILAPDDPELATSVYNCADALRRTGNLEEAADLFGEAVRVWRSLHADNHASVLAALLGQAEALHALGRFDDAVPVYRRVIELARGLDVAADVLDRLRSRLGACRAHVAPPPEPEPPFQPPPDPFSALTASMDKDAARSYRDCMRAFMARHYGACVVSALEHCETSQRHDVIQLLSIALQRLRLEALADHVADWAMEVSAGTPYQALLAFTAGRIDASAARAVAAGSGIEHEYELYAACRLATLGSLDEAADMFERVSTRRPRSLESALAVSERLLRGVAVDAAATPAAERVSDITRRIERLFVRQIIFRTELRIRTLDEAGDLERALAGSRELTTALEQHGGAFPEDLARALNNTAHLLFTRGRYAESLPYYERSRELLRRHSSGGALLGAATNNLGNVYQKLGRHRDAVRLQVEALAERRRANGDVHHSVLLSLLDLAGAHAEASAPAKADKRYREALEIAVRGLTSFPPFLHRLRHDVERALAAGNLQAAQAPLSDALSVWETTAGERRAPFDLHRVGRLYLDAGNKNRAQSYLVDALRAAQQGRLDSVLVAECLYDLGRVEELRGNQRAAADYHGQAQEVLGDQDSPALLAAIVLARARTGEGMSARELAGKALQLAEMADDRPLQAAAWHQLGVEQRRAQRFKEAAEYFERALALRQPDDSWGRVQGFLECAGLAIRESRLPQAEDLLRQVETLIQAGGVVPHSAAAIVLHWRGRIALARRESDQALACWRAALDRQSSDSPSDMTLRGAILADLGPLFTARREPRVAGELLREALRLATEAELTLETGLLHVSLAECELALGALLKASGHIRTAHDLLAPVLGDDDTRLGKLWFVAGSINLSVGAHATAEWQLGQARDIFARSDASSASTIPYIEVKIAAVQHRLGKWNDSLVTATRAIEALEGAGVHDEAAYRCRAFALSAVGQQEAALSTLLRRTSVAIEEFRRQAPMLPAGALSDAAAHVGTVLDELLSLAVDPGLSELASPVFAAVQAAKAIAVETVAVRRELVAEAGSETVRRRWREIGELRSLIGRTLLHRPDEPLTADERRRIGQLESRAADLERDLFAGQSIPDPSNRYRRVDAAAVAKCLAPGEMLVEYVRFNAVDLEHPTTPLVGDTDRARYCAFGVVRREAGSSSVELCDLGRAVDIDTAVQDFRDALVHGRPDLREQSATLRRRLLDPLFERMGEPSGLTIAPDGALNALPFDALTWSDGRWLLDACAVSFVDVGRDVVRSPQTVRGITPLVIAAPDFNLREGPGSQSHDATFELFPHLAGAEREGQAVATRLGVTPFIGRRATESALKNASSPLIAHLATHGFFIPQARYEGAPDHFASVTLLTVPGEGTFMVNAERPPADDDFDTIIHASRLGHPLLRSGLVLAGANTWLAGGVLPVDAEDGVVTGLDVLALDFAGTALVVLSACETGLGVSEAGSSLVGLRQAFLLAGARTVVVSLWKVEDTAATVLMEAFYERLLAGQSRSDALRLAKGDLRSRGFDDPVHWAGFSCVGDPSTFDVPVA